MKLLVVVSAVVVLELEKIIFFVWIWITVKNEFQISKSETKSEFTKRGFTFPERPNPFLHRKFFFVVFALFFFIYNS